MVARVDMILIVYGVTVEILKTKTVGIVYQVELEIVNVNTAYLVGRKN